MPVGGRGDDNHQLRSSLHLMCQRQRCGRVTDHSLSPVHEPGTLCQLRRIRNVSGDYSRRIRICLIKAVAPSDIFAFSSVYKYA